MPGDSKVHVFILDDKGKRHLLGLQHGNGRYFQLSFKPVKEIIRDILTVGNFYRPAIYQTLVKALTDPHCKLIR